MKRLVRSFAFGVVFATTSASADDSATSLVLFNQAKTLAKQGKWAEACPMFEESQKLDPSINTLYQVADCQSHTGMTASAWANFNTVADLAKTAKETAKEAIARKRANELEPKLCKMEIRVVAETPGLVVKRKSVEVPKVEWGIALPMDPGGYLVDASAPSSTPWAKTVVLESPACEGKTATVEIPALEKAGVVPVPPPPATSTEPPATTSAPTSTATTTAPTPLQPEAPESTSTGGGLGLQRTLAIVAGGVGAVGIGVGLALRSSGKSQYDDAVSRCTLPGPNPCSESDANDATSGANKKSLGWIVVGTGGALVLGGLVLWLTAPSHDEGSAKAQVVPMVGAGVSGIEVQGRF